MSSFVDVESIVCDLRARGYRVTPQRLAILRLLRQSKAHPSAETIYQQLRPAFPNMSLATVYKTLAVLKSAGHILDLGTDGCNRYDGNAAPHPHLVCTHCQRIIDLPEEELLLPEAALDRVGFVPQWSNLIIHGLCAACRQKPAHSPASH